MDELVFRGTERPKFAWWLMILPGLGIAINIAKLSLTGGIWAGATATAAVAVLFGYVRWAYPRSWCRVDVSGISYSRGGLWARHLAWGDVVAVEIRDQGTRMGVTSAVRITRRNGRHRTLPVVMSTPWIRDPAFSEKAESIVAIARRFGAAPVDAVPRQWVPRPSMRRSGLWQYLVAAVAVAALAAPASQIPADRQAAQVELGASRCPAIPVDGAVVYSLEAVCQNHYTVAVDTVVREHDGFGDVELLIGGNDVSFGAAPSWLSSLAPGTDVRITAIGRGPVIAVSDGQASARTTSSSTYSVDSDVAAIIGIGALALFLTVWATALLRARLRRLEVRSRWWVLGCLPGLLVLEAISIHAQAVPSRQPPSWYAFAGVLFLVGPLLGAALARRRSPGQNGGAAPLPQPSDG
ncbi:MULTISPECIES: hypothetical protein [Streptacidiphilus]|uniref:PH domain-containing protein n=1 Tax=Streptacidiphilus cavernicola TaxID=3342716 RepID=A0ABV6UXR9_9ACTN|nr:hypothetical protein [Streptacidiphilus jeojiense]